MFKKIKYHVAQIGLGTSSVYAFFLIPSIEEQFTDAFLIILRQTLIVIFAICLWINPRSLIDMGSQMAPKLITFFKIFFTNDKHKDNDEL